MPLRQFPGSLLKILSYPYPIKLFPPIDISGGVEFRQIRQRRERDLHRVLLLRSGILLLILLGRRVLRMGNRR
jgi:hypothetical protein